MNPKNLLRPEYVFQPRMVLKRFSRALKKAGATEVVTLPWGLPLKVRPSEVVGSVIWCYGLIDLVVAEAIARLLDPGETALDVGANIGQMTGLMALVCGEKGRVLAFEAHPVVAGELRDNVGRWKALGAQAKIEIQELAVSDAAGEVKFSSGKAWEENRGIAKVISNDSEGEGQVFTVPSVALDDILPSGSQVGLCKLDVEGHEDAVLRGCKRLLSERRIRDIAFEDLDYANSKLPPIFHEFGYTIFSLHSDIMKPRIAPARSDVQFLVRDGCNFIATLDPQRTKERFSKSGWRALRRWC